MKILAKVMYKGTNYFGWQKQTNVKSVEEEIEKCLSQIMNEEIDIIGAGRTDAGVHAKGQTFHFEVNKEIDINKLRYSLNCMLPKDIHIVTMEEVDNDFHARYSAKGKHYSYLISVGENNPFLNEFSYIYLREFDFDSFKKALLCFVGTHCFKNFTSKDEDNKNFIRTVDIKVTKQDNIIKIDFIGDGFMRYMIRYMVGTAIAVMEKRISESFILENLKDTKERKIVLYKAPAEGLTLEEVKY